MRYQKKKFRILPIIAIILAIGLGVSAGAVGALYFTDSGTPATATPFSGSAASLSASGNGSPAASVPSSPDSGPQVDSAAIVPRDYNAMPLPKEMRAMWISFLEWRKMDFSSAEKARAAIAEMFDNSKALGLNTVMVAVRPFGDALYKSAIFPYSHMLGGAQGQDPGFDPLAIMVEEAHSRDLRIEAWINPYRVQDKTNGPKELAESNPAAMNPALVRNVGGNLWYDPGLPEVQQMVMDGVLEIVQQYDVDGIHFDDYFYPEFSAEQKEAGTDVEFDASTFDAYAGEGVTLAQWRRENVNALVASTYKAVKSANPTVSFGISPQGNNDNNYDVQFSDVKFWMSTPGYVDYVMPQLYWGFNYVTKGGRDRYAFANITAEWAFYPRIDEVKLYAGLAAYRLGLAKDGGGRDGFGDGGAGDMAEWESGHNLADMVSHLRDTEGFSGFSLFRYEFLYQKDDALSEKERDALEKTIKE